MCWTILSKVEISEESSQLILNLVLILTRYLVRDTESYGLGLIDSAQVPLV